MTDVGHVFSVEIEFKRHVRSISTSKETRNRVLFEGDLGELEEVAFIGGGMLEVMGPNRILKVELGRGETEKLMSQMSEVRA